MSTILQMQSFPSSPFGLREKNFESFAPAFTSNNGRSSRSPPSNDTRETSSTGVTPWTSDAPKPQDGVDPSRNSTSPPMANGASPEDPNKRTCSGPDPDESARPSPDDSTGPANHPPIAYQPAALHHAGHSSKDNTLQRTLPALDRSEIERRWATEPRQLPQSAYRDVQRHEPRPTESFQSRGPSNSTHSLLNVSSDANYDDEDAQDLARPGVQVGLNKRKRQFAYRTKTGCGTCRKRKKKCDETKPECNNCLRGGFTCAGYSNKVPWPRPVAVKAPPPPLQAKERASREITSAYPTCPVCNQIHIPHRENRRTTLASYPPESQAQVSDGLDGGRNRPIVIKDERNPPVSSSWTGNGWSESAAPPPPLRTSYPSDPHTYAQPANISNHERPTAREKPVHHQHPSQPLHQQHDSRVYQQTPQSMSQGMISTLAPVVPAKTTTHHHQVAQHTRQLPPPPPPPVMVPPTVAPSGPPPALYKPLLWMHKSEKEKMLAGLPFLPCDRELVNERTHCAGAVYQFNSTANAAVSIAKDERARCFKTIVAARWIPPHTTEHPIVGHLGGNVYVATPFYCDYGYNLSIAENVIIGANCEFHDSARIVIGANTRLGNRIIIITMKTPTDNRALKGSNGTEIAQEVFIGKNVYIGDGCIIEAGVRIGDNAIVRAGSVVVRNLPRDCVAHGNPAFG
ncbi:maltose O-acetyltransferas-like protein [Plenodomus tracheiphilus IPT5]|uniref:Maltose O-acetyltransferas-like protein n=1 Tax=Plenodomus tracheiphilus IPT5 TaxID=1408161 RepID=A0A6A7AMM3_9PLEO|nr:maltose O-acetyltransferas-like protein [Plenodomus tracheiphilus IPT5]